MILNYKKINFLIRYFTLILVINFLWGYWMTQGYIQTYQQIPSSVDRVLYHFNDMKLSMYMTFPSAIFLADFYVKMLSKYTLVRFGSFLKFGIIQGKKFLFTVSVMLLIVSFSVIIAGITLASTNQLSSFMQAVLQQYDSVIQAVFYTFAYQLLAALLVYLLYFILMIVVRKRTYTGLIFFFIWFFSLVSYQFFGFENKWNILFLFLNDPYIEKRLLKLCLLLLLSLCLLVVFDKGWNWTRQKSKKVQSFLLYLLPVVSLSILLFLTNQREWFFQGVTLDYGFPIRTMLLYLVVNSPIVFFCYQYWSDSFSQKRKLAILREKYFSRWLIKKVMTSHLLSIGYWLSVFVLLLFIIGGNPIAYSMREVVVWLVFSIVQTSVSLTLLFLMTLFVKNPIHSMIIFQLFQIGGILSIKGYLYYFPLYLNSISFVEQPLMAKVIIECAILILGSIYLIYYLKNKDLELYE